MKTDIKTLHSMLWREPLSGELRQEQDEYNSLVQGSSSEALPSSLRYYLAIELKSENKLVARFQYYGREDIIDATKAELEANRLYSALVHSALGRMIHGHILTTIKSCYGNIEIQFIKGAC